MRHLAGRGVARRISAVTAVVLVVLAAPFATSLAAAAPPPGAITFSAALNGQPLDLSSSSDPIVIDPDRNSTLALDLRNSADEDITVRQVQIRGKAFGITLIAYDVTVNASVPAHGHVAVDVPVEFVDLGQQTDGLLPATIRLLSPDRTELASLDFTVDVRGSASSLILVFTLVVGIATAFSIVAIWVAIGRRRLPPNRFRRGVRLAISGAGVGVTLVMFLSIFLLVSPAGSVWIPLLLVPTVGAFILGFVSPGPLALDTEDDDVEDWMRETVVTEPGARGPTVVSAGVGAQANGAPGDAVTEDASEPS